MAYAIIHHFPGGTQEQYDAALESGLVHPSPDVLPEGQIFHAAGPSEGGWTIFAVHDTKESWERFRDERLLPGLPQIQGTFEGPPQETTIELHKLLP